MSANWTHNHVHGRIVLEDHGEPGACVDGLEVGVKGFYHAVPSFVMPGGSLDVLIDPGGTRCVGIAWAGGQGEQSGQGGQCEVVMKGLGMTAFLGRSGAGDW